MIGREIPTDELWLHSEGKLSQILGNPFYEFSEYRIRWILHEAEVSTNIDTTVMVKKNIHDEFYRDPAETEKKKYQDAISKANKSALHIACRELGGTLHEGIDNSIEDVCTLEGDK